MLEIELNDKKYKAKAITGRMKLEHARLIDKISKKNIEKMDGKAADFMLEECKFICKIFNDQFDIDEFLDFVPAENIDVIFYQIGDYINKKVEANIQNIIKN
ncbi:MAG: phage tail assembly chaperone G [Clostridium sp.]